MKETEFLGHWISQEGISLLRSKVRAIQDSAPLTCVEDVCRFLGLTSYYRKFIPSYAHTTTPLTNLTKKDVPWNWGTQEQQAFTALKTKISDHPILILPDPNLPYTIVTDASSWAFGAVLMQAHGSGLQPIDYLSKKMIPTEQKHLAYERELGSMAFALNKWRHYVEGCTGGCTVLIDHHPLINLMTQAHHSRI